MVKEHLADNDIPESELTPQQQSTAEIRDAMTEDPDNRGRVYRLVGEPVSGDMRDIMDESVPGEEEITPDKFHF